MSKEELKASGSRMFSNAHKDNANKAELLRCVKACNGDYMARHGEQLSDTVVNEVYSELELQYFTN